MTGSAHSQHPADGNATTAVDPQNPWLGLASFTEETRAYFHGRDEEVAELGRRVQRKLLTILFGQSGLGKTSILRAGLVPRLRAEGYCPVYVRLDYSRESPPPSEQIKQAILRTTSAAGNWSQPGISQTGETLWEFLHHRDDVLRDASGRTLIPLLIFDQFEEIFTLAQSDDFGRQRAAEFADDLADLVENRAPKALEAKLDRDEAAMEQFDFARADYRILLALREDYLAHLEGLKAKMPSVTQNRMRLARMTGVQALAAVTGPGAALVSDEVARAIVRFVAGSVFGPGSSDPAGPGTAASGDTALQRAEVEPSLLSLVCRELNAARLAQGRAEISADLLAGSRDTILAEFYERALADQPPGVRVLIEDELLTDSGYRESIAEERLKKGFVAAGATPESLAALVDRRLLRVEERLDMRRVELTHDVLCEVVKASRDARKEQEGKAAIERQLAATRATEAATRRALWRARMVAAVCAVLAIAAAGSAIYGYINQRRARLAELSALDAAEIARGAGKRALESAAVAQRAMAQAETARQSEARLRGLAEAARQSEAELRSLAETRLQSELAARQEAERQASLAERERNRALAAEKAAADEAQISQAVNDFLRTDLLAQASPENEPNRDITLRAVLDRASANIETRFAGQPLVEAGIRATLGATYSSLGEFALMHRHVERALTICREQLGPEHPSTLSLLSRLADAERQLGKYAEAEALGIKALEARKRVLGAEHPGTLGSMVSLSLIYRAVGKLKEAEALNRQALEIQHRVRGPNHPETLATMRSLGMICIALGRRDEAETLLQQTLEAYQRDLGDEHPNTLGVMSSLAQVFQDRGKLDAAEGMFLKVLRTQNRVMGERHPSTLNTRVMLAAVYRDQAKFSNAEALLSPTLTIQREVFGAAHMNVAATLSLLAQVLQRTGDFVKAEATAREALQIQRKILGAEHWTVGQTQAVLGRALLAQGRPAEAEPLFRSARRIAEKSSPEGWERYGAQLLVAQSLVAQKQTGTAEPLMRNALEGLRRTMAPVAWQAEALMNLIQLYTETGKAQLAATLNRDLEKLTARPTQ